MRTLVEFEELGVTELAELTSEDRERWAKLIMAKEGLPLPGDPPECPRGDVEPDLTGYTVDTGVSGVLMAVNMDIAKDYVEYMKGLVGRGHFVIVEDKYDRSYREKCKVQVEKEVPFKIGEKRMFSEQRYSEQLSLIDSISERKSSFEKSRSIHDQEVSAYQAKISTVAEKVSTAIETVGIRNKLQRSFDGYVELLGNRDQASKAYRMANYHEQHDEGWEPEGYIGDDQCDAVSKAEG